MIDIARKGQTNIYIRTKWSKQTGQPTDKGSEQYYVPISRALAKRKGTNPHNKGSTQQVPAYCTFWLPSSVFQMDRYQNK